MSQLQTDDEEKDVFFLFSKPSLNPQSPQKSPFDKYPENALEKFEEQKIPLKSPVLPKMKSLTPEEAAALVVKQVPDA